MILKERLTSVVVGQMQGPTGPGPRNPYGASPPNSPADRCQPSPVGHANRAPFPRQAAAPSTQQPGVQWSSTVLPPPQSGVATAGAPVEVSPIDMKWGVLFDQNGAATKRWEQVVRGIGRYLVSQCLVN